MSTSSIKIARPKISVYAATSVDGYIARQDEQTDFLESVQRPDEDYGYEEFLKGVDALVLGRKTFEVANSADEWPYPGKRVIVLSDKMSMIRKEAELYYGDIAELMAKLHKDGIKHLWVDGGMTISRFLEIDLVDEIILSVVPILLGSGIRLFKTTPKEHQCRLVSSKAFPSGLVQTIYQL
jgi:dihydrofolate reductase